MAPLSREPLVIGDNEKDEEVIRSVVKAGQIRELNYCPEQETNLRENIVSQREGGKSMEMMDTKEQVKTSTH